ncbi:MAG: isoprenylcysteine carboxylmethyltransferase family protein [Acidobacteriota bacterium]|nr:isoprenylcysteine carboxylmethyltransferase family protein [Acidobacteriota bacterium]
MDSRLLYSGLVLLVACERVVELGLSRRNAARAIARGAVEHGRGHYPWMVVAHTLFLLACPLEVWWLGRPFDARLGIPMLALVAAAMGLRYWAVTSLGERWNTRVIVQPGLVPVAAGPYRYLRHPNYLAVVVEILALPLVHSAWITAIAFSLTNVMILQTRIRVEDAALAGWTAQENA